MKGCLIFAAAFAVGCLAIVYVAILGGKEKK